MTREEAYNRIDVIIARHEIDDDYVTITSFLDYDALRMARKTLEQEPCEDAVSRAYIMQRQKEYCGANCQYSEIQREFMCKACMMGDAIEMIEDAPPVTPKHKWIPVDYDRYPETYPKAFQEVWITDAYGEVYHKAYDGTRSIKAWMPYVTPEPYREVD